MKEKRFRTTLAFALGALIVQLLLGMAVNLFVKMADAAYRLGTRPGARRPGHAGPSDSAAGWRADHARRARFHRGPRWRLQRWELLELSRRLQLDADGGRPRAGHVGLRRAALSHRNSDPRP